LVCFFSQKEKKECCPLTEDGYTDGSVAGGVRLSCVCAAVCPVSLKRRHLFDRYSIVFHSFSVSERENDGKHIGKR
jgi:hypothetical protein